MAAVSMLLSSCVGDLHTNRVIANIGFDPIIGHDTRAEESVPFPLGRTFNVWATNVSDGSIYIDNESIAYKDGGWTSSQKWPMTGLSFEAYSPSSISPEFSHDKGIMIKDFDCSKGDVDILVAHTDNADMGVDTLVTLPFEHILSRIEFRMLESMSEEMSVKVRKIEMIGFASRGDFSSRSKGKWTVGNSDFSYVIFDVETGVDLTSEPIYLGEEFYTIPQLCTAKVKVLFDVKYGSAEWIPQEEEIEELDTLWEPNTHYTYTLNLTESKLTYTTGISSWNNRE